MPMAFEAEATRDIRTAGIADHATGNQADRTCHNRTGQSAACAIDDALLRLNVHRNKRNRGDGAEYRADF